MEFKVGDRVTSKEVEPRYCGDAWQEKHLEIETILGNKANCIYFLESEVTPKIERYTVSLDSLTLINHEGLKRKGAINDRFFKR